MPVGAAPGTAIGMALYTACNPLALAAQRILWAAAVMSNGRLVPGRRELWSPRLSGETIAGLWPEWTAALGQTIRAVAAYERIQADRAGVTLLLCGDSRSALVRVRDEASELEREQAISSAAGAGRPRTFQVPTVVGKGRFRDAVWVAYLGISRRPHYPVRQVPTGLMSDVSALVERAVPRPAGTPAHWRGAHGDLTPWNLRRAHTGIWLIDWEDAGWLPPGADEVYYRATSAAIGRREAQPLTLLPEHEEARAYWRRILTHRRPADTEARLHDRLRVLLDD